MLRRQEDQAKNTVTLERTVFTSEKRRARRKNVAKAAAGTRCGIH